MEKYNHNTSRENLNSGTPPPRIRSRRTKSFDRDFWYCVMLCLLCYDTLCYVQRAPAKRLQHSGDETPFGPLLQPIFICGPALWLYIHRPTCSFYIY